MKLTKQQLKKQKELIDFVNARETFTEDETETIYRDFNEGFLGDVSHNSAYFTGYDLAMDFALMSPTGGLLVDMCAGFGVLAHCAKIRDHYEGNIKKIICIERDQKYIDLGRKLVRSNERTEVIWLRGDMFDEQMWNDLEAAHGKIDCIISNPPFGKVSRTDKDRSWLKYKGSELDIAAIEVALRKAKHCSFILPQGSCTFKASKTTWHQHVENRKIDKLKKDMNADFYMAWQSIDTGVYEENFKNTSVCVECCTIDELTFNPLADSSGRV